MILNYLEFVESNVGLMLCFYGNGGLIASTSF